MTVHAINRWHKSPCRAGLDPGVHRTILSVPGCPFKVKLVKYKGGFDAFLSMNSSLLHWRQLEFELEKERWLSGVWSSMLRRRKESQCVWNSSSGHCMEGCSAMPQKDHFWVGIPVWQLWKMQITSLRQEDWFFSRQLCQDVDFSPRSVQSLPSPFNALKQTLKWEIAKQAP